MTTEEKNTRTAESIRMQELVDLRGEHSRVFLMSDGTEQAVFYPAGSVQNEDVSNEESETGEATLLAAADTAVMLTAAADGTEDGGGDPSTVVEDSASLTVYAWADGVMSESGTPGVGLQADGTVTRAYFHVALPVLPRNPRIKKAELRLTQTAAAVTGETAPLLGLYPLTGAIETGSCTPTEEALPLDYDRISTEEGTVYAFDVTALMDGLYKNNTAIRELALRLMDETAGGGLCSLSAPELCFDYEAGFAVNNAYRAHTHDLGRFGQARVDLARGSLTVESEDFAWGGSRLPVTIKHLYNSAYGGWAFSGNPNIKLYAGYHYPMHIGYGWKLNVMQSMVPASFCYEGVGYSGYVHMNDAGEEFYFKPDPKDTTGNRYVCVTDEDMRYDKSRKTMSVGEDSYLFDGFGRLISITDSHENRMDMTYVDHRLQTVSDGSGRVFTFTYDGEGFLTALTAPDGAQITYTYDGNYLRAITYPTGEQVLLTTLYERIANVRLKDADGQVRYRVQYAYENGRLITAREYGYTDGVETAGVENAYTYAIAGRHTRLETVEPAGDGGVTVTVKTVYAFDDDGGVVGAYTYAQDGNAVGVNGEGGQIHPYAGDGVTTAAGHTGYLPKTVNSLSLWNMDAALTAEPVADDAAVSGTAVTALSKAAAAGEAMLTRAVPLANSGEYTFSLYLRAATDFAGGDANGVCLRVQDANGLLLAESEWLAAADEDYLRLCLPFTVTTAQTVQLCVVLAGEGAAYVDLPTAQLEDGGCATDWERLNNGGFELGAAYGFAPTDDTRVTLTAEEMLQGTRSLQVTGSLTAPGGAAQTVPVRTAADTRETFTLSGWAKGCGLPVRERHGAPEPTFRLRAVIGYVGGATETHTADFAPHTTQWQQASVQFTKEQFLEIDTLTVFCDYDYQPGTAYFDCISLIRDSLETGLTEADFETGDSGTTAGEESPAADDGEETEAFAEAVDAFGNTLTETTFTEGAYGALYRAYSYDASGTDRIRETDARGCHTYHAVDGASSRIRETTDRCGARTAYTYDGEGRTVAVVSKAPDGSELSRVGYTYGGFGDLSSIDRGDGLRYTLTYDAFRRPAAIGIAGKTEPLVAYGYKAGSGRLKEITYANGDRMTAVYNTIGQMIAEKWYDRSDTLTKEYRYTYDGQGNIVRSIDKTARVEYTYAYEQGQLTRAAEYAVTFGENDLIIARTLTAELRYRYNREGQLTEKRLLPVGGQPVTVGYTHPETGDGLVQFTAGGRSVTTGSETDSLGRKTRETVTLGTGFVSREFRYLAGAVSEEHRGLNNLPSPATTQLVSQIVLSDGRTLSYEYDAEERITRVTDSVEGVTAYTYDHLGQLLTETHNGETVNVMTYDGYGNLRTRNGHVYGYGDSVWKDLLTWYDGEAIRYDAQGNPVAYRGHTLRWEKGRQLQSFDGIQYTYNANGIRTGKTVDGVEHTYRLEGSRILQERWGAHILTPLYDREDSVCGMEYDGAAYYFLKNLQGDVIALTDADGETLARYRYDAWGKLLSVTDRDGSAISDPHHPAFVNPYRYRSYYYDAETGLYYLQSRYYDPEVGRFVNGDAVNVLIENRATSESNLYAYCRNSCVIYADYYGFGRTVLWAAPQCPENVRKALGNSKLVSTRGAVFRGSRDRYFDCERLGNGMFYYSFIRQITGTAQAVSYYLVGILTKAEWTAYNNRKNPVYDKIKKEVSSFLSAFNEASNLMCPPLPDKVTLATTIAEWIVNYDYRGPKRRYIQSITDKYKNPKQTICIPLGVVSIERCYYRDWFSWQKPYWHTMRRWKYVAWR